METKIMTVALVSACFVLPAIIPYKSFADDQPSEAKNEPFFEGRYNWQREENERDTPNEIQFLNQEPSSSAGREIKYKPKLIGEGDFKDRLIADIPYGEDLKYMWDVVDGDIDLHVTGLRADRRNKGISYTTNEIPFVGDIEGLELKFKAGDTNEVSFKSSITPFIGKIEGLSYSGKAGNDGSKIVARYSIKFD